MFSLPLHPQIVHFPIAFLIGAGVFYLWSILSGKSSIGLMAFYLHVGGLLATIPAILSGDTAEADLVESPALQALSGTHETLGMVCAWIFGMLVIWVYLRKESRFLAEKISFGILYWAAIGLLAYSAHLGGKMVYEEGAGIAHKKSLLEEKQKMESPPETYP